MFIKNKFELIRAETERLLGKENVFTDGAAIALNSYDCSLNRGRAEAVLNITRAEVLPPLIKLLHENKIPFTPRASATNHVGGCVSLKGGVVLNLYPLNKILKIDTRKRCAEVECCVINADLQAALAPLGFFYAPDPASEKICTLGGNAALNAGGARGMKYGATAEHILGLEYVSPQGEVFILDRAAPGPDIAGLITGSEGTLGLVTRLRLKITPKPEHVKTILTTFNSVDDAMNAVSAIKAAGVVPRCIEAMDRLTTRTVEDFAKCGYPKDCEALLLIESDGDKSAVEKEIKKIEQICQKHGSEKTITAKDEEERLALWRGRSGGYAAMARLAPNVFVEDGTVPVSNLAKALEATRKICAENNLTTGLFFHAGDGNLHPNVVFDQRKNMERNVVQAAGREMLKVCADAGGTISGEHGVGIEKRSSMAFMYNADEIEFFYKIKTALDPHKLSNPDKVLPVVTRADKTPARELPACYKETAELFKKNTRVQICGYKTQAPKISGTVEINTKDFDEVLDIDLENYCVTARAGIKLADLKKELLKKKVYLCAPDYAGSLGGLYNSGISADFNNTVLGIEIITAEGKYLKYGGKFAKNAAGYSITRFLAGSLGAYAFTGALTVKIYREEKPASLLPAREFAPSALDARLKAALDPHNILNPLLFEGKMNG